MRRLIPLLLFVSIPLSAQVWTQVTMPRVSSCTLVPGGPSSPSFCLWGSVVEPVQPAWPSPENPLVMINPGTGVTDPAARVGLDGCWYQDGIPGEIGGPSIWQWRGNDDPVQPGNPCITQSLYFLETGYIDGWSGGYGLEVNASFRGLTTSGQAAVFYTDNQFTAGGREYGVAYVWQNPAVSNFLWLYWSSNTNCPPCYTTQTYDPVTGQYIYGDPISEQVNGCVVNTDTAAGGLDPSKGYIYDLWFTMNGSTPWVNCQIRDGGSEAPLSTNYFLPLANFTWDAATGIFGGPADSWFNIPHLEGEYSAGWYAANIFPYEANALPGPENATMYVGWVKVAK